MFRKRQPKGSPDGGQYAPDTRGKTPPSAPDPVISTISAPTEENPSYTTAPIIRLTPQDAVSLPTPQEQHNHKVLKQLFAPEGTCPGCDTLRAEPSYRVSQNLLTYRATPLTVLSLTAIELARGPVAAGWTQSSSPVPQETLWLAPRTDNGSRNAWYSTETGIIKSLNVKLVDPHSRLYLGEIRYLFTPNGELQKYDVTEEMGTRRTQYNAYGQKHNGAFPSYLPDGTSQWWKNGVLQRQELKPENKKDINPNNTTSRITTD